MRLVCYYYLLLDFASFHSEITLSHLPEYEKSVNFNSPLMTIHVLTCYNIVKYLNLRNNTIIGHDQWLTNKTCEDRFSNDFHFLPYIEKHAVKLVLTAQAVKLRILRLKMKSFVKQKLQIRYKFRLKISKFYIYLVQKWSKLFKIVSHLI